MPHASLHFLTERVQTTAPHRCGRSCFLDAHHILLLLLLILTILLLLLLFPLLSGPFLPFVVPTKVTLTVFVFATKMAKNSGTISIKVSSRRS